MDQDTVPGQRQETWSTKGKFESWGTDTRRSNPKGILGIGLETQTEVVDKIDQQQSVGKRWMEKSSYRCLGEPGQGGTVTHLHIIQYTCVCHQIDFNMMVFQAIFRFKNIVYTSYKYIL